MEVLTEVSEMRGLVTFNLLGLCSLVDRERKQSRLHVVVRHKVNTVR